MINICFLVLVLVHYSTYNFLCTLCCNDGTFATTAVTYLVASWKWSVLHNNDDIMLDAALIFIS